MSDLMNINEFLSMLIDSDCELRNIAFKESLDEYRGLINNIHSKISIAISSSFFNENIRYFSQIPNINYLQRIICLPIFYDNSNIILIVFNPQKQSDEFVLIDESDSLFHQNEDDSWFFIEDDLAFELSNLINNYKDSDNAVYLNAKDIFKTDETQSVQTYENDEFAEILSLKKPKQFSSKNKVIFDSFVDELLDVKEKYTFNSDNDIELYDSSNFINDVFYYKKRQNPENLLNKNNKPLIEGNVEFRKLGKICDLKNINVKNSHNTILIATCKQCDSKIVYYNHDVENFKDEVYVEIDNISDILSMDYLYEYLNSDNGKSELMYYSKGNKYLRAQFIKNIKIPIPPLDVQKEIVKASRESREFFKTVDLLKNQFNSNIFDYKHVLNSIRELKGNIEFDSQTNEITALPRCWRHAYQGLIWPLAISYLTATKGGFEIVEKKNNYITLFEFLTAFNSIILLSGLPEDLYKSNFESIWDSPKGLKDYKQMTFGNWYYLYKNLAEVYKNNNFTSKLDEDLFKKITSDRVLKILKNTHYLRNDESHTSLSNVYEADEIFGILDNYLEEVFDILEVFSNYKLIYTTGDFSSSREGFNHRVILLNGPCAQPIYENFIFDSPLLGNSLYLYNPKNNKKLEIKDNFMKFAPTTDKKRWALFIYYKCDRDEFNAYYKCFQSKEQDLKFSITSLRYDILD